MIAEKKENRKWRKAQKESIKPTEMEAREKENFFKRKHKLRLDNLS